MRWFSCVVLLGCGVEETGFLTDEGVVFTADGNARIAMVLPEAVREPGGELVVETLEGMEVGRVVLDTAPLGFGIGQASGVRLIYTLDQERSERQVDFALQDGAPPQEDLAAMFGVWVEAEADALRVYPDRLLGQLPYIVVNTDTGATSVVLDLAPRTLEGQVGDRVCVSSLGDDTATAAMCRNAEVP